MTVQMSAGGLTMMLDRERNQALDEAASLVETMFALAMQPRRDDACERLVREILALKVRP